MKRLFAVRDNNGQILSYHENKKEAKKIRDEGKNLHVTLGPDHRLKQEQQVWK